MSTHPDLAAIVEEQFPCASPGYFNDGDCGRCPQCASRPAALRVAVAAARWAFEEAAKIAENVRDGYTANIRADDSEQEFSKDPNGPWVLNSDVCRAIREAGKL